MSSTTDFLDPRTRDFAVELANLELKDLQKRYKDIQTYMEFGIRPNWTVIIDPNKLINDIKYWSPDDLLRYRRLIMIEMLDRCKSFELVPTIKFKF